MHWQQLIIYTTQDKADFISELLFACGAVSVSFADDGNSPVYEPQREKENLWDKTQVHALFTEDVNVENVLQQFLLGFDSDTLPPYKIEQLPDTQWERVWMEDFKPLHFGGDLWVCPSWCEPTDPNAVNLRLDPGLAFGSGTHGTTFLCMQYLAEHPPKDLTVIDYGCGCGILALAALKLGAKKAYAVDMDKDALIATKENARENNISEQQLFCNFPENLPTVTADLLLANILCGPLCELAPRFAELVKPQGHIVLSGILTHQVPLILEHYAPYFVFEEPQQKDEWICLRGRRT